MMGIDALKRILAELAKDVFRVGSGWKAEFAFNAYKECLAPLVKPYIQNGFIDQNGAQARFFSETATLHLAVSMVSEWCALNNLGHAEGFWDICPEARFFSWYHIPKSLMSEIHDWVKAHPDILDAPQSVALIAEDSLSGLRRRTLGEFFTPNDIAQHLLFLTHYDPLSVTQCKIVDPACGSGNLLRAVVIETAKAVQTGLLDPCKAVRTLNENIFGFDIQPIAVLLTRLQLLLSSFPILKNAGLSSTDVYDVLSFPNTKLEDPLASPERYWEFFAAFDLVLGNPPFLKVKREDLLFIKYYDEVLGGQPNLYQLFLWWAIKAAKPGGYISFLVPQSIRSGQYLDRIRHKISETCEVTAVTSFRGRTGVFDSVDQLLMIVTLRKLKESFSKVSKVTVQVRTNGFTLSSLPKLDLDQNQVVRRQDGKLVWCISEEALDYTIMAKVCEGNTGLRELGEIRVTNGGFVWNQHKDKLLSKKRYNGLPLVSSASVGINMFLFPPEDKRVSQRLFVDTSPPFAEPIYNSPAILIKRTTPKKEMGRRIEATQLPTDFLDRYPSYLVENHVNLIVPVQKDSPTNILAGLVALLNSKFANFVFCMMNGSSHLSKFELEIIPAPFQLVNDLDILARHLNIGNVLDQRERLDRIDELVFSFFNLSPDECQRVKKVIPTII